MNDLTEKILKIADESADFIDGVRKESYQQGKADAIKSIEKFVDDWDGAIIISASMGVVCGQEVIDELKELLVQMKEKKDE